MKILEALALGTPVISTSKGAEGLDVVDGEHVLIADDARAFASRIIDLFENPELGFALGQSGRALVEREYSWDHAGARLLALYDEVATGGGCGPDRGPGRPPRALVAGETR